MLKIIRRILDLSGHYKRNIQTGILCSLLYSVFATAELFAILYLTVNLKSLTGTIIFWAFIILLIGIAGKMLFKWQVTKRVSGAGYDVFEEKRLDIGERLKAAPMGYFTENQMGEVQSAATTSINDLETSVMQVVENILGSIIYAITSTCVLFLFNWRIGCIALGGLLVGIIFLNLVQRNAKKETHLRFSAMEKMTGKVMEFVQGISVMRIFGTEKDSLSDMQGAFQDKRKADIAIENAAMWPVSLYRYTFRAASCVIILIASLLCLSGEMSFAFTVMFLFAAFQTFAQMDGVAANFALLRAADTALNQIDRVLTIPKMSGEKNADVISNCTIDLKHVSFSYGEREIIHDISLHIPEKTMAAIVGPSGGGKTTLCNLIARFWDVQSGEVMIGGINIKEINSDELMTKMSFVFQNVYLFHDTVENNIRFGKPNATQEEVEEAAQKARCHDFIQALPQGYQTMIGESGSTLSGGERQRISIARAILKDAPIVILDEATSSVDPENQHALMKAIDELTKDKTLITIAHRLSTVRNADQIVVVSDGRIVQLGTHDQLAGQDGTYRRFMEIRRESENWSIV